MRGTSSSTQAAWGAGGVEVSASRGARAEAPGRMAGTGTPGRGALRVELGLQQIVQLSSDQPLSFESIQPATTTS